MSIMYILIGCSVVIAAIFLGAFLSSVKGGQFDDTVTPGMRILMDDKQEEKK